EGGDVARLRRRQRDGQDDGRPHRPSEGDREGAGAARARHVAHDWGAGVDAVSFTGSQSGIITNATHAGARILEVRPYRVQDELDRGRVVVIAGFQGVSYAKEIT